MRAAALSLAIALAARAATAAPPTALVALDGSSVALAPEPGRAQVVHFWATWCPSCKDELPALDRAAAGCGGAVDVIAVDVGDARDDVVAYLAERPIALRVLLDPDGRAWRAGGGRELPANRITSAEHTAWVLGPSSEAQWRARLAELGCPPHGPE